ncbi:MAG: deoxyribodipyrimidine photo-lyase [Phycisphaeraceae bacterium]|nr:deoxyribodipyrimidine photo-lyase [Phycisphaeraceae bacterium]
MPNASLVWFRNDLRTDDQTALRRAIESDEGGGVVGLFLPAEDQWIEHDWGANKIDFVLRQLAPLRDALVKLNVPLLIAEARRFDDAPRAIGRVCRKHGIARVHFNEEYEVNEQERDQKVRNALEAEGIEVHTHHDQTIVPPAALRTGAGDFFKVFSPYKRRWLAHLDEGWDWQPRKRPRPATPIRLDSDPPPELDASRHGEPGPKVRDTWKAGETYALARLTRFVREKVTDYREHRDFPAIDGTSGISPYLAAGVISPRRCLETIVRHHGDRLDKLAEGPGHWVSEIIWREFYKHVLMGFPWVCRHRAFRREMDRIPWRKDDKALEAWKQGRTGVPIVDAAMRQLTEIGWMHNRLRMIVAMYLSKDLFLDWREGEKHFMRHLVDGDLASNNGGWQWSASTGTDAAPYFRIFNPISQSKRFDPEGEFIRRYVPELRGVEGDAVHDPSKMPSLPRSSLNYPEPIRDHAQAREHVLDIFKNLDSRAS